MKHEFYLTLRDLVVDIFGGFPNYEYALANFEKLAISGDPVVDDLMFIGDKMFSHAQTWEDVQTLYLMFVKGELPSVPTHQGPLELESRHIVTQLKSLISMGAITIDSQPGVCTAMERQRAYVEFIVNDKTVNPTKLLQALARNTDVLVEISGSARYRELAGQRKTFLRHWPAVSPPTMTEQQSEMSLIATPRGVFLPITLSRVGENQWSVHSRVKIEDGYAEEDTYDLFAALSPEFALNVDRDDIVTFRVHHTKFCTSNLLDMVVSVLEEVTSIR